MNNNILIALLCSWSLNVMAMDNDNVTVRLERDQRAKSENLALKQKLKYEIQVAPGDTIRESKIDAVVSMNDDVVILCDCNKKEHDVLYKNQVIKDGIDKVLGTITFYCKGFNQGGCKSKTPSQLKIRFKLLLEKKGEALVYSEPFLLQSRRAAKGSHKPRYEANSVEEKRMNIRMRTTRHK